MFIENLKIKKNESMYLTDGLKVNAKQDLSLFSVNWLDKDQVLWNGCSHSEISFRDQYSLLLQYGILEKLLTYILEMFSALMILSPKNKNRPAP